MAAAISATVMQPGKEIELSSSSSSSSSPSSSLSTPLFRSLVDVDLTSLRGVVVRQETQFVQALAQFAGLPYEAKNRYKISALPAGKRVMPVGGLGQRSSSPSYAPLSLEDSQAAVPSEEEEEWWPTNEELAKLPALLYAHEESPCLRRTLLTMCGCNAQRCLKMHFFEAASDDDGSGLGSSAAGKRRVFSLRRPLRLGLKTVVPICLGLGQLLGQVLAHALGLKKEQVEVAGNLSMLLGLVVGIVLLVTIPDALRLRMVVGAPRPLGGQQQQQQQQQLGNEDDNGGIDGAMGSSVRQRKAEGIGGGGGGGGDDDDVWYDEEIGLVEETMEPYLHAFSGCRKFFVCCCCCTNFTRLVEVRGRDLEGNHSDEYDGAARYRHVYTTRANMCCCGAHNNCCASTCCHERFVMDIIDAGYEDSAAQIASASAAAEYTAPTNTATTSTSPNSDNSSSGHSRSGAAGGRVVSHLVRTYSPSANCCDAFCRCYNGFSQYLVEFPEGATQNQRLLLLASFISTDLEFFDNNQ